MKSFEALQKTYEKEIELAEKHKQKAADIKKEMEVQRGNVSYKKINALNFTGQEYDKFMRLLDTNKKTVLEAIDLVLGTEEAGREETDTEEEKKQEEAFRQDGEEYSEEKLV